ETTPPFPLLQPVPIIGSLSIHSNPPVDSIKTSSGTSKDKTVKSSTKPPTSKHVAAADNSIIGPMSNVKFSASANKGKILPFYYLHS
ncbi:unnamed protein product, partial [Rotaria magnacalcarata]